ncbi:TraB/GumN family protein [Motiliproteus sp. MSK22-1]|uniref:TraB/GumN family protein n=1 Tax=Motiliproteus sp. MSK22-1 TaxID=1897630 RepID=UPI000975E171|nr:TraB/GumN family protein [Motiliproteus sp. MSK22-1]OMH32614.1 hypothetical protein BGP75_13770 [Motiliproteus sp. MSK22-1]
MTFQLSEFKSLHRLSLPKLALLLLLPLILTTHSRAQGQENNPYLWRVEKPGFNPSFLFGTIHSAHPELNTLPDVVTHSFEQSDAFYGELEMTPEVLLQATQLFISSDNSSLQNTLSQHRQQRINRILDNIHPGLSLSVFSKLKLWAFTATLALLEDQIAHGSLVPMDMRLFQIASFKGKQVGGLETIEEQSGVFESFSQQENLLLLDSTLDYMEKAQEQGTSVMEETYQAYRSGNPDNFSTLMESQLSLSPALANKLNQRLLVDRNLRMAERISKLLQQQPQNSYFFAVGAAHYSGASGIQKLLQKKGYQVTRVNR